MRQKQLSDVESTYKAYRMGWCDRISKLEQQLQAANSEVAQLQQWLVDSHRSGVSRKSKEIASLKRIVSELSKSIEIEKAEVQQLKLQLACE